jgi:hypothetical protein
MGQSDPGGEYQGGVIQGKLRNIARGERRFERGTP